MGEILKAEAHTPSDAARGGVTWIGLLRRYLQMYWLKPLVAVNDAANAWTLRQFAWERPILELGAGDGVFSFIMHGGEYALIDDRYDQSDPGRAGDMFDAYPAGTRLTIRTRARMTYDCTVDMKESHARKCVATGLYRHVFVGPPEPLPFADSSFKTVFLYFPHGLVEVGQRLDYPKALAEIRRVLRPDGTLILSGINDLIEGRFVCYPLAKYCERMGWAALASYFHRLDAGRYEELSGLGHSLAEWRQILNEAGFRLEEGWSQVRPIAWTLYDVQTRPFERALARGSKALRRMGLKIFIKAPAIYGMLPLMALFYVLLIRPRRIKPGQSSAHDIFFSFRAVPTAKGSL